MTTESKKTATTSRVDSALFKSWHGALDKNTVRDQSTMNHIWEKISFEKLRVGHVFFMLVNLAE